MISPNTWLLLPAAAICAPAYGAIYLSVEAAQKLIFPNAQLTEVVLAIDDAQRREIEKRSGMRVRQPEVKVWRSTEGGVFIVDEVTGKHESIVYAVGIAPDGGVKQIEILEYRETYGFEIRNPNWRQQFTGKTVADPLKLDQDIKNVTGATLSCRHVTEGVKRLLATYDVVLKRGAARAVKPTDVP
jgi:Na+-translocating ferredoxin:NAD+ oxidoreductase RnfG subunit